MKQELDNLNLPFMAKSARPAWLPEHAVEAREIAWWSEWVIGLFGILFLIGGLISFLTLHWGWGAVWAGYLLVSGVLSFVLLFLLKSMFFDVLDQGKFKEAADKLLILAIIGLFLSIVPGALLLFAYLRLREVFQPNYQPYPAGTYQAGPAQPQQPPQQQPQYSAPPSQQAPPPPPQQPAPEPPAQPTAEQHKKADMVKCRKCGVQYPSFMRTCPNCNEPR